MDILDSANIIRQKRKTIKVEFNNYGRLNIYCPYNLPYKKIEEILLPKYKTIIKKSTKIKNSFERNKDILNYKKVLVLGKEYLINITEQTKSVFFSDNVLFVPIKYAEIKKLGFIIKKTLISIANSVLRTRANKISEISNVTPKDILVGSYKAKWGSCDNFKIIKFNWKLIMLPENIIDFVIYHELSHLQELNHSKRFYEILEKYEPNHKFLRKKLKEYNYLLEIL